MATVTVRAALPLTWLALGHEVTVERTKMIDGAIRTGALQVVAEPAPVESPAPEPPLPQAVTPAPATRPRKRSRSS